MSGAAIGIDLGATRIKAGLVTGVASHELVRDVGARDPASIVATLAELIHSLEPGGASPVGIAAAGVIEQAGGRVRESPNFPLWRDFPLAAELAQKSGRRIVLDNDANAVILGEARFGVARGKRHVIGYTLGTGVGGGLILDGQLYRGERGMAGELGHVTVVPDGRPCGCGNRGCLEQYVGQVGLITTLRALGPPLADLTFERRPAGLPDGHDAPQRLRDLADLGDPAARAVFAEVGRYLGQAAAALVHTLDVTTLVLAGGIAGAFAHIAPPMHAELARRTFRSMSEGVVILQGSLGARAGVLGAAALALSIALPTSQG